MPNQTKIFTPTRSELNNILDYVTEVLLSSGLDSGTCEKTRFRTEDLVLMLMDKAFEGSSLKVTVRKSLTATTVRLVCAGAEFDYQEAVKELFSDALDEETEILVREKVLKHYQQDVIVSHRGSLNIVTITAARRKINQLVTAAAAVLLGIAAGLAVKMLCPGEAALYIAEHVFGTGTSLFLNAVKMVVPFMVFFIHRFRNLRLWRLEGSWKNLFPDQHLVYRNIIHNSADDLWRLQADPPGKHRAQSSYRCLCAGGSH